MVTAVEEALGRTASPDYGVRMERIDQSSLLCAWSFSSAWSRDMALNTGSSAAVVRTDRKHQPPTTATTTSIAERISLTRVSLKQGSR